MVQFHGQSYPIVPESRRLGNASDTKGALVVQGGKTYQICEVKPQKADTVAELFSAINFGLSSATGVVDAFAAIEIPAAQAAMMQGSLPELTDRNHDAYPWAKCSEDIQDLDVRGQSGRLYEDICSAQQEIVQHKREARSLVRAEQNDPELSHLHGFASRPSRLVPCEGGAGGAYFLKDDQGVTRAVVKPADEDAFNLHNRKQFASPYRSDPRIRMREGIEGYRGAHNESLGYQIAKLAGCEDIAPKTTMAIIEHDGFHVLADHFVGEVAHSLSYAGEKEKLCSVQEFVQDATPLSDVLTESAAQRTELNVRQQDFEDCNLLVWLTGDQDAHNGNFVVYQEPGQEEFRLKKIDNGLILAEAGCRDRLRNDLIQSLPRCADQPLSQAGKDKILGLPASAMISQMQAYGCSEGAVTSFTGRVLGLQRFILNHPNATIQQINAYVSVCYSGDIKHD